MAGMKSCVECSREFHWIQPRAMYCSEKCKKRNEYRRLRNDPVFQAKRAAARLSRKKGPMKFRRKVGPDEQAFIIEMRQSNVSCAEIARQILKRFGWERSCKVVAAISHRSLDTAAAISPSAEDRIPDYSGADSAFVAAMRAAPECPREGVYKNNKPLVVRPIARPVMVGGSPAGDMADCA